MISVPHSNNISRIADWVELYILVYKATLSKSKILSILQKEAISIEEEDIDSVISELERRLLLYGRIKPFQVIGSNIRPKIGWKKYPEYALCLYYSAYGVGITTKGSKRDSGTKYFEDITKCCLEKYLLSYGHAFGFPSSFSFKKQLDSFASRINEKRYDDPNPDDKDRGVDIIVYKQFDEIRGNCILLFVQCAAGKNWNDKKTVPIDSYRRYFSFNQKSVLSSLAITQVVDINDWQNACSDYGLIIDRARLFRLFSSNRKILTQALNDKIIQWIESKLIA